MHFNIHAPQFLIMLICPSIKASVILIKVKCMARICWLGCFVTLKTATTSTFFTNEDVVYLPQIIHCFYFHGASVEIASICLETEQRPSTINSIASQHLMAGFHFFLSGWFHCHRAAVSYFIKTQHILIISGGNRFSFFCHFDFVLEFNRNNTPLTSWRSYYFRFSPSLSISLSVSFSLSLSKQIQITRNSEKQTTNSFGMKSNCSFRARLFIFCTNENTIFLLLFAVISVLSRKNGC